MDVDAPVPSPESVLFARGVIARLAIYPTLKLAVQDSWGGPDSAAKRTWMSSVIVDAFEDVQPPPDTEYVEEMLFQMMEDEFDVNVEDGSLVGVAQDLLKLWAETRSGENTSVLKFEALESKFMAQKPQFQRGADQPLEEGDADEQEWASDDEDDDGEASSAPQLLEPSPPKPEPIIDEDGFTLVQKGRR